MATKQICDFCNKEIIGQDDHITLGILASLRIPSLDICLECWQKSENWPRIHYVEPEVETKRTQR